MRTQKVRPAPKKKPMRVEIAPSARKSIAKAINNDWRTLAEDAIHAAREATVLIEDDDVRAPFTKAVAKLYSRSARLAGQLEMFGGE